MFKKRSNKPIESKSSPSDYRLVNNRFSFQFPGTWEDKSIYTFEGPEEDGIRHNIWVTIENNVQVPDLERYAQINIQATENELQGYRELKQSPLTLANQQPAYEHVYRWVPVENRGVYQKVMYVLKNNTGYILTSTFSKKTWKKLGGEIDKIFRSFTPG
jgi:hypothetical protein